MNPRRVLSAVVEVAVAVGVAKKVVTAREVEATINWRQRQRVEVGAPAREPTFGEAESLEVRSAGGVGKM